jgi:hypothetical protein
MASERTPANQVVVVSDTLRRVSGSSLFRRGILPILLVVLLVKAFTWACLTYVRPNEYGIKVVRVALLGRG